MDNNSAETARLLEQGRAGDQAALNEIFARHRPRLRRMVELRLDRRLSARIDASDVLQEAEEMTLAETALALGIEESAAAKRYVRALKRLKATLANMSGGVESV